MPNTQQYVRRRTDEEERQRAREKVMRAARDGTRPADAFAADDLAWAFVGHEDEFHALDAEARQVVAIQADNEAARHRRAALDAETDAVLKEWDHARRMKARGEARKRLLKKGELAG